MFTFRQNTLVSIGYIYIDTNLAAETLVYGQLIISIFVIQWILTVILQGVKVVHVNLIMTILGTLNSGNHVIPSKRY